MVKVMLVVVGLVKFMGGVFDGVSELFFVVLFGFCEVYV